MVFLRSHHGYWGAKTTESWDFVARVDSSMASSCFMNLRPYLMIELRQLMRDNFSGEVVNVDTKLSLVTICYNLYRFVRSKENFFFLFALAP